MGALAQVRSLGLGCMDALVGHGGRGSPTLVGEDECRIRQRRSATATITSMIVEASLGWRKRIEEKQTSMYVASSM